MPQYSIIIIIIIIMPHQLCEDVGSVRKRQAGYTLFANHYKTRMKPWNWYAPRIVCKRWFLAFCETRFVLFCQANGVPMTNSKGFFTQTEEVRLRCETLDDQRIVCSMVFVEFRELTIFSVKLSFHTSFVVVCE